MNKILTKTVLYRGREIPVSNLSDQSQIIVEVECHHGVRRVRYSRRNQLCKKCSIEAGVFNTSKPGREITWGNKISDAKKGISFSEDHRKALSIAQYGVSEEDWPGFYEKSIVHQLRDSQEYIDFRNAVMKRDNYKCVLTGMGGKLNVHHLDGVSINLDKIFDIDNGVTLHSSVHKMFHDMYGRGQNTPEQFEEFAKSIRKEDNNG